METITSEEMAIADENSEYLGVKRILLMENAGRSIVDCLNKRYGELSGKSIVIFCGTGNNGGDGMVAARHLSEYGARVAVVLVGNPEKIRTEEACMNWRAIQNMKKSIEIFIVRDVGDFGNVVEKVKGSDIIIDGIFGTGIKGEIRDPWLTAIRMINGSGKYVVVIDVPSGMDPDTGNIAGEAVIADVTISFHKAKPALLMEECKRYVGELVVAPIGMPPESEVVAGPGDLRVSSFQIGKGGGVLGIALDAPPELMDIVLDVSSMFCKEVILLEDGGVAKNTRTRVVSTDIDGFIDLMDRASAVLLDGPRGKKLIDRLSMEGRLHGKMKIVTTSQEIASASSENFSTIQIMRSDILENLIRIDFATLNDLRTYLSLAPLVWGALKRPFLLVADFDLISDGKNVKANWLQKPVRSENLFMLYPAVASSLLSWGVPELRSLASSSFLARSVCAAISERGEYISAEDITGTIKKIFEGLSIPSVLRN